MPHTHTHTYTHHIPNISKDMSKYTSKDNIPYTFQTLNSGLSAGEGALGGRGGGKNPHQTPHYPHESKVIPRNADCTTRHYTLNAVFDAAQSFKQDWRERDGATGGNRLHTDPCPPGSAATAVVAPVIRCKPLVSVLDTQGAGRGVVCGLNVGRNAVAFCWA